LPWCREGWLSRRSSRCSPVTDEQIQHLADQAETGYDTTELRREDGRKPIGSAAARVIPVRFGPELRQALKARAAADHAHTSEVIRDALRAWLAST
jgi:CRISPR-associated endonuclease/helicase Cas3